MREITAINGEIRTEEQTTVDVRELLRQLVDGFRMREKDRVTFELALPDESPKHAGRSANASTVVFTYIHRGLIDGTVAFEGGARMLENVRRLGEPWTFGLDPMDVAAYLGRFGLTLREDLGADEYRPLLAIMINTFKLSDEQILSLVIDGAKAGVHWRAKIFSRLTGTTVLTDLVDMIEIRDGRIGSYIEFFAPR